MEAFEPRKGSGQSLYGPCLSGPGAPPPQETWARGGCPRLLSLLSTCQWRTSVLPSSGGEQPVTVGSLWIQQAAFVSPNSDMLQKATEWAGDWFLYLNEVTFGKHLKVGTGYQGKQPCD